MGSEPLLTFCSKRGDQSQAMQPVAQYFFRGGMPGCRVRIYRRRHSGKVSGVPAYRRRSVRTAICGNVDRLESEREGVASRALRVEIAATPGRSAARVTELALIDQNDVEVSFLSARGLHRNAEGAS